MYTYNISTSIVQTILLLVFIIPWGITRLVYAHIVSNLIKMLYALFVILKNPTYRDTQVAR